MASSNTAGLCVTAALPDGCANGWVLITPEGHTRCLTDLAGSANSRTGADKRASATASTDASGAANLTEDGRTFASSPPAPATVPKNGGAGALFQAFLGAAVAAVVAVLAAV